MMLNNKIDDLGLELNIINSSVQKYREKVNGYLSDSKISVEDRFNIFSRCEHIYLGVYQLYNYPDSHVIERFMEDYMGISTYDMTTCVLIVKHLEETYNTEDMERILDTSDEEDIHEIFNNLIKNFKQYCMTNKFFNIQSTY